ncbi:MAG: hypothetical protein LBF94_01245, partial [Puniceicoccales bacterium]|nr:hypothetical protein [Puniceicoccales bacterium]
KGASAEVSKASEQGFWGRVFGKAKDLSPENFTADTVTYKDVAKLSNEERRAIMVCISETSTSKLHTLQKRGPEGVEVLLSLYGSLRRDDAPTLGGVGMKSYYSYFAAESVATMPLGDRKKLMEHLSQEDLQNVAKNNYKTAFILCASLEKGDTALINKLEPVFQELSRTVRNQICGDNSLHHYWGKSPGVPVSKSDFERLSQTKLGSLVVLPAILAFSKIRVRPYSDEKGAWMPDVRPLVEQALKNVDPDLEIAKECYGTYNIDQYHEELEVANLANRLIRREIQLSKVPDEKKEAVQKLLEENRLADLRKQEKATTGELPPDRGKSVTDDDLVSLIMQGLPLPGTLPLTRRKAVLDKLPIDKVVDLVDRKEIQMDEVPDEKRKTVIDKLPIDSLAVLVNRGGIQLNDVPAAKKKGVLGLLEKNRLADLVNREKIQMDEVPVAKREAVLGLLENAKLIKQGELQLSKVSAAEKRGVLGLLTNNEIANRLTRREAQLMDVPPDRRAAVQKLLEENKLADLQKQIGELPPEKRAAVLELLPVDDLANLVDLGKAQLSELSDAKRKTVIGLLTIVSLTVLVNREGIQLNDVPPEKRKSVLGLLPDNKVVYFVNQGKIQLSEMPDAKREAVLELLTDADLANLVKKGKIRLSALPDAKREAVQKLLPDETSKDAMALDSSNLLSNIIMQPSIERDPAEEAFSKGGKPG